MRSIFRRIFYAISYLGKPPWDTGISPPELMAFINSHPPGRAIDLGCGSGTNLLTLAEHGWVVTGIDFSSRAVQMARQRLSLKGMEGIIIKGDVSLPLKVAGLFDLILDIGCYHDLSLPDRLGYHVNITNRLSPGGTFLIYAHCLTEDRPKATGVSQADIEVFSKILKQQELIRSTDRWGRQTIWMTFIKQS